MRRGTPLLALALFAALPIAADRLRSRPEGCAMDGGRILRDWRVRVVAADSTARSFCSVTCARRFVERSGDVPREVIVTEATHGREIDARDAWLVRTVASRDRYAPDRFRVFASRDAAERHAAAHGGAVEPGSEAFDRDRLPPGSPAR